MAEHCSDEHFLTSWCDDDDDDDDDEDEEQRRNIFLPSKKEIHFEEREQQVFQMSRERAFQQKEMEMRRKVSARLDIFNASFVSLETFEPFVALDMWPSNLWRP